MEYIDIHFWEEKRGCFQGPLSFITRTLLSFAETGPYPIFNPQVSGGGNLAPCSRFGHPCCVFHAVTSEWFRHGHMIHFEPSGINGLFSFALLSDRSLLSSGCELGDH